MGSLEFGHRIARDALIWTSKGLSTEARTPSIITRYLSYTLAAFITQLYTSQICIYRYNVLFDKKQAQPHKVFIMLVNLIKEIVVEYFPLVARVYQLNFIKRLA